MAIIPSITKSGFAIWCDSCQNYAFSKEGNDIDLFKEQIKQLGWTFELKNHYCAKCRKKQ